MANFVGATRNEIVFTRGASEAINLVAYSWGMHNLSESAQETPRNLALWKVPHLCVLCVCALPADECHETL